MTNFLSWLIYFIVFILNFSSSTRCVWRKSLRSASRSWSNTATTAWSNSPNSSPLSNFVSGGRFVSKDWQSSKPGAAAAGPARQCRQFQPDSCLSPVTTHSRFGFVLHIHHNNRLQLKSVVVAFRNFIFRFLLTCIPFWGSWLLIAICSVVVYQCIIMFSIL